MSVIGQPAGGMPRCAGYRIPHRLALVPAGSPTEEHLAAASTGRDLCLDTLPYNAHTTASDAPVGRAAGADLHRRQELLRRGSAASSVTAAVGLPELVAASLDGLLASGLVARSWRETGAASQAIKAKLAHIARNSRPIVSITARLCRHSRSKAAPARSMRAQRLQREASRPPALPSRPIGRAGDDRIVLQRHLTRIPAPLRIPRKAVDGGGQAMVKPSDIENCRIAVIGAAGTMRGELGRLFPGAQGLEVIGRRSGAGCARHVRRVESTRRGLVLERLGLAADAWPDRWRFQADPSAAADGADFCQESAPERYEIKIELLLPGRTWALPREVVIASSSSGRLVSRPPGASQLSRSAASSAIPSTRRISCRWSK